MVSENQSSSKIPVRRIVLTGFMGSGKSTVGPIVAARLGWQFVDVDNVIEAEACATIADIFARQEKAPFATANTLPFPDSQTAIKPGPGPRRRRYRTRRYAHPPSQHSRHLLVHLEVELNTTLARCSGTENARPVLADHANLAARYHRRMPLYRMAHVSIHLAFSVPNRWQTPSWKLPGCT